MLKKFISKYNMAKILNIFSNCDYFSLTWAKQINCIPAKDKENLINNSLNLEKEYLKERYNYFTGKENNLPNFQIVFNDIVNECKNFYQQFKDENFVKSLPEDYSPFICDHVGKDTKYNEPQNLFWHFYHNIANVFSSCENLDNIPECDLFDIDKFIAKETDMALKNNFVKYEYTFQSHCTKGPLQLVFIFKLNDETKKWLLQFDDDYDLAKSAFQDLAIYKENKLKFSSCTHERFNSLTC